MFLPLMAKIPDFRKSEKNVALALGTLGAVDLHLVSLVIFEEYTLAEAAAVLNISPSAAKTRMQRARE